MRSMSPEGTAGGPDQLSEPSGGGESPSPHDSASPPAKERRFSETPEAGITSGDDLLSNAVSDGLFLPSPSRSTSGVSEIRRSLGHP